MIQDYLTRMPLIAILRGLTPAEAVPVGRALMAAGFSIIEVPLNSPQTLDSIASLSADLAGDCLIGADTVTTPKQVSTHRRHGRARQSPPWASPHRAHRRGWLPWRLNVPRRGRILGRPEPRFQILYAQMISNPRHASPPRLMAHQPTRFPTTQESSARVHRPESVSTDVATQHHQAGQDAGRSGEADQGFDEEGHGASPC